MDGQIFISYRREDSLGSTGRIYDRLLDFFPREQIFMDVDTIQPGTDFVEAIEKAVSDCDVLLAVIGRDWLDMKDRFGRRMLDNPSDFVRTEIKAALQRNVRVIPILVEDSKMPNPDDLPDDLKALSRRHALELHHTTFHTDADRLIKVVQDTIRKEKENAENKAKQRKAREAQQQAQKREAFLWETTLQVNTIEAYVNYLNQYTNGRYAAEATKKIEELQREEEVRKKWEAFNDHCAKGKGLFERRDFQQAMNEFDLALQRFPENAECREWIEKCRQSLMRQQQEEEQRKEAERLTQEENKRQQILRDEARRLEHEKREAERQAEREVQALEQKADKLKKSRKYQAALEIYQQVLQIQPGRERVRQSVLECEGELEKQKVEEQTERSNGNEGSGKENEAGELTGKKTALPVRWLLIGSAVVLFAVLLFFVFGNKQQPAVDSPLALPEHTTKKDTIAKEPPPHTVTQPETIGDALQKDMVFIDGGEFTMGSDKTPDERPAHQVVVGPFWLSKYEVTRAQWNRVMDTTRFVASLNLPANNVSWNEVQIFLQNLNRMSGKTFRLPTEPEWEYASVKGFGEGNIADLDRYSWNKNNSGDTLHPVGQRQPDALGLYDLLGNVYEWCADSKSSYDGRQKDDRRKMIRGGDFKGKREFVSQRARDWNLRSVGTARIGFRLAKDNP